MVAGTSPPPSAPISPIIEPATAVVVGHRSGTSWNKAPLPAPSAAKHTMKSKVVTASDFVAKLTANSEAATIASTSVSVFTPPHRSEIQPPATRKAAAMNAASMVSWPACTLLTPNWSK